MMAFIGLFFLEEKQPDELKSLLRNDDSNKIEASQYHDYYK